MTNQYKVGEQVIISRESKGNVFTSESATVVTVRPQSVFVRLANGDVIKRKYNRVKPVSGGAKA